MISCGKCKNVPVVPVVLVAFAFDYREPPPPQRIDTVTVVTYLDQYINH